VHPRTLRPLLLAVLALAAVGCSSIDCDDPTRYIGAELKTPVKAPEGLDAPEVRDTHRIPGGGPPEGYAGGACLMKPPQLIAPPKDAPPKDAPSKDAAPAEAPPAAAPPTAAPPPDQG
jgi:hypothetical protein